MSFEIFVFWSCYIILFILNACVCQTPVCNNCCNNYKEINEPRRSIKSNWMQGQTPLCDRLISSGWYRFTSFGGTRMPETAVQEFHCGTHDPIWLRDSHPTQAEGNMARTACISSFGVTCSETRTINIKNCGTFYVYYLTPLDYCASAYCAGKKGCIATYRSTSFCNTLKINILTANTFSNSNLNLNFIGFDEPCPYGKEGEPPNCFGKL